MPLGGMAGREDAPLSVPRPVPLEALTSVSSCGSAQTVRGETVRGVALTGPAAPLVLASLHEGQRAVQDSNWLAVSVGSQQLVMAAQDGSRPLTVAPQPSEAQPLGPVRYLSAGGPQPVRHLSAAPAGASSPHSPVALLPKGSVGLQAQSEASTPASTAAPAVFFRAAGTTSEAKWLSAQEVLSQRPSMARAVESGSLAQVARQTFQACDKSGTGFLVWNGGEIREFLAQVLRHYGLHSPPDEQVYAQYLALDAEARGHLDLHSCQRMALDLVRAAFGLEAPCTEAASPTSTSGEVRSARIVVDWLANYNAPSVTETMIMNYLGRVLNIAQLANEFRPLAAKNAQHRTRIVDEVESGALMRAALKSFLECDKDSSGYLTWNNGEIREFVVGVLRSFGLAALPTEAQIYQLYSSFDADNNARLDARECICLVDAIVRAVFHLEDVSPRTAGKPRPVSFVAVPREAPEHPAVHMRLERLLRTCASGLGRAQREGLLRGALVSWRLGAVGQRAERGEELLRQRLRQMDVRFAAERERLESLLQEHREEVWRGALGAQVPEPLSRVLTAVNLMSRQRQDTWRANFMAALFARWRHFAAAHAHSRAGADGLLATTFADWRHSSGGAALQHQRADSAAELVIRQWQRGRVAGLVAAVFTDWHRLMDARAPRSLRAEAAVDLMVRQWRRSHTSGLLAAAFNEWLELVRKVDAALGADASLVLRQATVERNFRHWQRCRTRGALARAVGQWRFAARGGGLRHRRAAAELLRGRRVRGHGLLAAVCRGWRGLINARAVRWMRAQAAVERRRPVCRASAALLVNVLAAWSRHTWGRQGAGACATVALMAGRSCRRSAAGLLAAAFSDWVQLRDARLQLREQASAAVDLLVRQWQRGSAAGLCAAILAAWAGLCEGALDERERKLERRVHACSMMDVSMQQQERIARVDLKASVFAEWCAWLDAALRARGVVELALAQWQRGRAAGLCSAVLAEWGRLVELEAQRRRLARAHSAVDLTVRQWELGDRRGLKAAVFAHWRTASEAAAESSARTQAAVELLLRQWQRGHCISVLESAFCSWQQLVDRCYQERAQSLWHAQAQGVVDLTLRQWAHESREALLGLVLSEWRRCKDFGLWERTQTQWHSQAQGLVDLALRQRQLEGQCGALEAAFAAWRGLKDERDRQRAHDRAHDAVGLILQKWELGEVAGLAASTLRAWARLVREAARSREQRRAHAALDLALRRWGKDEAAGLLSALLLQWKRWRDGVARRKQEPVRTSAGRLLASVLSGWRRLAVTGSRARMQAHAAIELISRQWLRGSVAGLLGASFSDWHRAARAGVEEQARGRLAAKRHAGINLVIGQWERGKTVGLLAAILSEWRQEKDVGTRRRVRMRAHSAVSSLTVRWERASAAGLASAVLAQWRRCSHLEKGQRALRRSHTLVDLALAQWQRGSAAGLQSLILAEWRQLHASRSRRERAHKTVGLMLQQWQRGSAAGLAAGALSCWRAWWQAARRRARRSSAAQPLLARQERTAARGLRSAAFGAWRRLRDATAQGRRLASQRGKLLGALDALLLRWRPRQRALAAWRRAKDLAVQQRQGMRRGRQTEAVTAAMLQRWLRGKTLNLAALALSGWRRDTAKRRVHGAVELALGRWAGGRRLGTLSAALRAWRRRLDRRRAGAAVELMLRQWQRGDKTGLRASAFTDWRRVKDEAAGRHTARAAVLAFAEGNRRSAAAHACLLCWRHVVNVEQLCRIELAKRCQERSTWGIWLTALALSNWKSHLQELKTEESRSMVALLQEERASLEEKLASAYEQVDQVMATMQRELRTKELLAADLREVTLHAKLDLVSECGESRVGSEAGKNGAASLSRSLDYAAPGASSSALVLQTPARPSRSLTARPSPAGSWAGGSMSCSPWTAATRPNGAGGEAVDSPFPALDVEGGTMDLPGDRQPPEPSPAAARASGGLGSARSSREERTRRRQISPLALTAAEMRLQPLASPGRLAADRELEVALSGASGLSRRSDSAPRLQVPSSAQGTPTLRRVGSWRGTAWGDEQPGPDAPRCDWTAVEERLRGELRSTAPLQGSEGQAECNWETFEGSLRNGHPGGPPGSSLSARGDALRPCSWDAVASRLQDEGLLRGSEAQVRGESGPQQRGRPF